MKLLPYNKLCIITPLTPAEVEQKLKMEVAQKSGWSFFSDTGDKNFRGVVENGRFEFMRIIRNRNSFLPVIKGHTEGWLNGSRIYVTMRLHLFVAIFMCFWLGSVAVGAIKLLIQIVATGEFLPVIFVPIGMFVFGYAITMGFYSYERNKAKAILLHLVEGQIDEAVYHDKPEIKINPK